MISQTLVTSGYQDNWWQILNSPFMRNALIGGTLVAVAAGLIGYFIVVRRTVFAAHALAHIGFPGATAAVLFGLPPVLGLGLFCAGGALVIGALGDRVSDREVATGTILAMATGLGMYFNSLATTATSTLTNVLFGNLLAISEQQLWTFAALLAVLAISVGYIYHPLVFTSVNEKVAEAKGVPVQRVSVIFMLLLAVAVTMAVHAVGTLLLFALIVTPAATAIMLTANPVRAMLVSAAIGLLSVWSGLVLSAVFNLPPSFVIVTLAGVPWLLTRLWTRSRHLPARREPVPDHIGAATMT